MCKKRRGTTLHKDHSFSLIKSEETAVLQNNQSFTFFTVKKTNKQKDGKKNVQRSIRGFELHITTWYS